MIGARGGMFPKQKTARKWPARRKPVAVLDDCKPGEFVRIDGYQDAMQVLGNSEYFYLEDPHRKRGEYGRILLPKDTPCQLVKS